MFENLGKMFQHDGVQSLRGEGQARTTGASGTKPQRDGQVPLHVQDSRFLNMDGAFQGARRWMQ